MADTGRSRPMRGSGNSQPRSRIRLVLFGLGGMLALVIIVTRTLFGSFVVPTGAMENSIMAGDAILVNTRVKEAGRGDIIAFIFPGMRGQVQADEFQYYMKRCVAIAGDTLEIRDKKVFVNGQEQPLPQGAIVRAGEAPGNDHLHTFPEGAGYTSSNWGPMRVPKKGDVIPLNNSTFLRWYIFIEREGHQAAREGPIMLIDGQPATEYVVKRDYCFGMGDNRDNSLDSRYWGFIPVDNIAGKPVMVYWSQDPEGGIRWDRFFMTVE